MYVVYVQQDVLVTLLLVGSKTRTEVEIDLSSSVALIVISKFELFLKFSMNRHLMGQIKYLDYFLPRGIFQLRIPIIVLTHMTEMKFGNHPT